MLRQQIIDAINSGRKFCWKSRFYSVIVQGQELMIKGLNGSIQYLSDAYLPDVYESKE